MIKTVIGFTWRLPHQLQDEPTKPYVADQQSLEAGSLKNPLSASLTGSQSSINTRHLLQDEVARRCRMTKGDWCGNYINQTPIPSKAPPRADKECPRNCSNVGVCLASEGRCLCPAGRTGPDCGQKFQRRCWNMGIDRYDKNWTFDVWAPSRCGGELAACCTLATQAVRSLRHHCVGFPRVSTCMMMQTMMLTLMTGAVHLQVCATTTQQRAGAVRASTSTSCHPQMQTRWLPPYRRAGH